MTTWTGEELQKIGSADELELAALRNDGTLRKPVTIWVIRIGSALYVRSARAGAGAWYRGVQVRRQGRIWAGGVEKDVDFIPETDPEINQQIDAAYWSKYGRYPPYVEPMVTPEVRATTIRLVPR